MTKKFTRSEDLRGTASGEFRRRYVGDEGRIVVFAATRNDAVHDIAEKLARRECGPRGQALTLKWDGTNAAGRAWFTTDFYSPVHGTVQYYFDVIEQG